jgi:hypothetical protein
MVPATAATIAETIMQTGDTAVKTATVKGITVKAAKSATVETAAVKTAKSATVGCVGEIWLAEQSDAQQPSCNSRCTPPFLWPGSIGKFAHRKLLFCM